MANNTFDYEKYKGIQKNKKYYFLSFVNILKSKKEVKESRPCQQCRLNNQHASDVWMIWVMDSIPWVRCASGNVLKFISSILSSSGAEYQGQLLRWSLKLLNISPYLYTPYIYCSGLCCVVKSHRVYNGNCQKSAQLARQCLESLNICIFRVKSKSLRKVFFKQKDSDEKFLQERHFLFCPKQSFPWQMTTVYRCSICQILINTIFHWYQYFAKFPWRYQYRYFPKFPLRNWYSPKFP